MTEGRLNADVERYRQAAASDTAPPSIVADPLAGGASPIEQLVRILGLAANSGDPEDNARSAEDWALREAMTREAAELFAAQDAEAAGEMTAIGAEDPFESASQQLPQMAAGMAAALAGALSGAMQTAGQTPQQFGQAVQAGLGLLGQNATLTAARAPDELALDETADGALEDTLPIDDFGYGEDLDTAGAGGAFPGSAAAWGFGATAAAGPLGPPPVPSAPTSPAAAPVTQAGLPAPQNPAHSAGAPMSGVPMIPPGAPAGAVGTDRDDKTDTKRVAVPTVRNGAAVQGRIAAASPDQAAVTGVEGKPVATRRIVAPPAP